MQACPFEAVTAMAERTYDRIGKRRDAGSQVRRLTREAHVQLFAVCVGRQHQENPWRRAASA